MENGPDIKIRLPFAYVAPSSPLREATAQSKGWEIRMHKISCLVVLCSPNIGPFIYWGLSSRQPGSELERSGGDPRKGRRERGKEARCFFIETVFKEIMFLCLSFEKAAPDEILLHDAYHRSLTNTSCVTAVSTVCTFGNAWLMAGPWLSNDCAAHAPISLQFTVYLNYFSLTNYINLWWLTETTF